MKYLLGRVLKVVEESALQFQHFQHLLWQGLAILKV
jgi:hypothetical protein